MNCTSLSSRSSFQAYISGLRNATNGDISLSLVDNCRKEICGALWGSGNPDISGIGMTIGYLLESSMCLVLLIAHFWLENLAPKSLALLRMLLANAAETFYDNAALFTFAIQAASIATLTKVDFGISADGMGALTMQIVWLVSVLTLLPLLPLLFHPEMYQHDSIPGLRDGIATVEPTCEHDSRVVSALNERTIAIAEARHDLRFLFFVICWAMAFCPFFSRMGGTFGKSKIGESDGSVILTVDWKRIEVACFQSVDRVSVRFETFVMACGIMSYLLISVVVMGKVTVSLSDGTNVLWLKWLQRVRKSSRLLLRLHHMLSAFVFVLLAAQFWAFFRLRKLQKDMIRAAGGEFSDERWTFGQIAAVTLFLPVLVEVTFAWRKRNLYRT